MNQRDYSYYEAHGADVKLDEITSDEYNKQILHRLRDQDLKSIYVCERIDGFDIMEGDDLGWLAYFIGRSESLRELTIDGLYKDEDEGREHRMVHALSGAIARSRSIQQVSVDILSNDGFATIARSLVNLTQLERFYYRSINSNDRINDCVMIGSLLESGINLKKLSLPFCNIGYAGVAALANGLTSIGSSLKVLDLSHNDIDSEALSTLVAALAHCTCLEILDISGNDFSMAAAGLRSLSDWLQTAALTLDELCLRKCEINDEGLQGLIEGAANNCKVINLSGNYETALGLRNLHTSLQSERCRLKRLHLNTSIGDDDAEIFARSLVGNKSLKHLRVDYDGDYGWEHSITLAGWFAFSNVLCDTSTVNNTYLSNHTLQVLWDYTFIPYWDIEYKSSRRARVQYLKLNKAHPQHAAKCKILMHHSHLDMAPLLQWELKCLPLAIGWFERAKPCTSLPISYRCESSLLEESDEEFESRILTAMYQFVRGAPKKVLERRDELILVAAYDDKIAVVEEENKRLQKELEQRDRKIAQLEKRLREIAQAARNALEGEE
mmetsp:Transcript_3413/g.5633  ORF Transcript_3413/g.5633 Transcript_3413/m.5633 type:complete len:553 (-) Transcript_3413:71-1729(-)